MTNHRYEIHDRTVKRDTEPTCSARSKRRTRLRAKGRGKRRRRRRSGRGISRQGDNQSSCGNATPSGHDDDHHPACNDSRRAHGRTGSCGWKTLPEEQLEEILERENTSWIELSGGDFADQTLFERFTEIYPSASRAAAEVVEVVSSFCGVQTLQDLELGSTRIPSTEVYLDDRTTEGRRSDHQRRVGPLSRFPLCNLRRAQRQGAVEVIKASGQSAPRQNADRRVIYLTDLNPWGAMALASTASKNEGPKVRGMIYRHLRFQSFIRVRNVASNKFPFYEFEFALPYIVWRTTTSDAKPDDSKSRGRDEPLRNVQDLSFLSKNSRSSAHPAPTDYLCEAHTSVLISAIDPCRNISYALVDAGVFDTNTPLQDPWRYFWVALQARMEVVEGESTLVVKNLGHRIKAYIDSAPLDHRPFPSITSEQHCAWIRHTKRLLQSQIQTLKGLIREWKRFQPDETFSKDAVGRELSSVHASFQGLENCVWELECLKEGCDAFHDGVRLSLSEAHGVQAEALTCDHQITLYMNEEAHQATAFQVGLAKIGLTMTIVMLLVSVYHCIR
ncbi:hypothetical protein ACJZ2D_013845 [Fusarium nematophilum]